MTWEQIVENKINIGDIKIGSPEFEAMESAARNGKAYAQHSMGMWYTLTCPNKAKAKEWYQKAANQGLECAKQALTELEEEFDNKKWL